MTFQGDLPYGTPGGFPGSIVPGPGDTRTAEGKTYIAFLLIDGPAYQRLRSEIGDVSKIDVQEGVIIVAIVAQEGDAASGVVIDSAMTQARFLNDDFVVTQLSPGLVLISLDVNAIEAAILEDGAITTNKIAALAVTAAKIANDTITAAQIAANAIGTSELNAGAVTLPKITPSGQNPIVWQTENDANVFGAINCTSVLANGQELINAQIVMPNDNRTYFLWCDAGAACNAPAGQFIWIASKIRSGGATIVGISPFIGTGTVGGERWFGHSTSGIITGTGQTITMALAGKVSGGAGSIGSARVDGWAIPIPFV